MCVIWAMMIWLVGFNPVRLVGFQLPERQAFPKISVRDFIKAIPVSATPHSISPPTDAQALFSYTYL